MSERDTHFLGFAELLISELMSFQDTDDRPRARTVIARHAYDLVDHTITALWPYINDNAIDPNPRDIPDLTAWPDIP